MLYRVMVYPLGIFKGLHRLGIEISRDLNNKRRFREAIIDSDVCLDARTSISPNVHILSGAIINSSSIAAYTYVGKNTIVQHATIGKFCSIGSGVSIGLGKHPTDHFSTATIFYRKRNTLGIELVKEDLDFEEYLPVEIGHDVWIGTRALIMDGVTIGTGAIIAANSVVVKDVHPYAIVGGVPAKILKYRFEESKINSLLESEWWNWDLENIRIKMDELNKL